MLSTRKIRFCLGLAYVFRQAPTFIYKFGDPAIIFLANFNNPIHTSRQDSFSPFFLPRLPYIHPIFGG